SLVGVYDALLDDVMRPSILIDSRRNLVQTFGGAGRFMQVPEGRTTTDVAEMLRDDLRVAVTGALQRVLTEHRAIRYRDLRVELGGQPVLLDLTVREVRSRRSGEAYALVTFDEQRAPTAAELAAAPIAADQLTRDQVVALETQLRHTKENLQTTIEELETSNEELQATNEELMASNEELQTTNEELHSVNEELYTVNTEYQKKLAELTQVTADMDHLLASTDVHTLFLDRELRIRRFTPKMAEIFHLVPADVGRRIEAFNHVLSRAAIADDVRTVVATGQPFEQQVQHTQQGWYLLRVLPYRRGRQTEGAVLTLTDVTSLKRAEQDAQEASNRRDRFLATLSHELRNPLAAVLNASRVLTHGDLPPKEVERWHAVIMQRGEHMSRLVDDLLDVARLTQDKLVLQRQTMDLSATARGVLDEVEATYRERGITLETDFEDGVAVWGDATRLHQVQVNLLSNAARHTPAGGRVTYSVHRVDGAAEIRVADDGEGIAPEMRERIFELFVQGAQPGSRGRDGGLGVGLALVRRVTELHGGTVAVESGGAGKGAEFRVRIPLATRPVAEAAAASGRVSERPGTVLIVDDDPYIRSGMCKLFQLDDIAVRAAADGEEGLAMLTQHAPPDLVLLDIGLPRMDGYELCRRMRATPGGGDLLMFALTGFGQDSDREAATRAGFDAHLTKPVDIDEVYALYARHRGTRPERPAITIEPSPAT
ncbi:MAG TPA: ATP-binding protein, partial [Polyangiaceae bacterium]|nr:ATP-binding protein [Polyangiaceae bacterium]